MLFDTALNTTIYQTGYGETEVTTPMYILMIADIGIYAYLITKLVYFLSMIKF